MNIDLKQENGKTLSCKAVAGRRIGLIVWRRNGGALLPLVLGRDEAFALRAALSAAINTIDMVAGGRGVNPSSEDGSVDHG